MKVAKLVFIVSFVCVVGCVSRTPDFLSQNSTTLELEPDDIVITGPTQGSTSVPVVFFIPFGVNSYQDAEQAALRANGSDVLIDRVRYAGLEGLWIPLLDIVIFGSQTWYVEGIGAKYTK